jgi:predicted transcriptional regulator YheO
VAGGDVLRDRELLESYIPMVRFIAAICGPRCEVVLHDLKDIEHSIIAIENGHISGRKVGDGMMDFAYKKFVEETNEFFVNHSGKTTNDNKTLRLSAFPIRRKSDREVIGLLCVTVDITDFIYMQRIINSELFIDGGYYTESENPAGAFALPLSDTLEAMFLHAMQESGCESVDQMDKDDKMRIISILKDNNLFEIKGTVSFIAKKLKISEPSVYRYLKEVRNSSE